MSFDIEPQGAPAAKLPSERLVMHVLYAMHTFAWFSGGALAVVAMIVNYIKRADETDPLYRAHHDYLLRSFWWTALWLLLSSPLFLLFFIPGWLAWIAVSLWYLYRCIRGWLCFVDSKMPPVSHDI